MHDSLGYFYAYYIVKNILSKETQHNIMCQLGEVMYMGTFGKSVMEFIVEAHDNFNQFFFGSFKGDQIFAIIITYCAIIITFEISKSTTREEDLERRNLEAPRIC